MKRRTVLVGGIGGIGAVGALLIGWSVLPPRQRLATSQPLPAVGTQVGLNGWVKVAADNTVTIMMCRSEMGQGVHTGLAMVLADELDANWAHVKVEHAPVDKIYNNLEVAVDDLPFRADDDGVAKHLAAWLTRKLMREIGEMVTGGSSSLNDLWDPMREAGASARAMLIGAAAARWNVPAGECRAQDGKVLHPSGKTATFGELAAQAGKLPLPAKAVLKQPSEFKLIGKDIHRIEAASKIDGTARFGIDVLPEGLLYASVTMCPTLGGTVASFDGAAATALPGIVKVLAVDAYNGGTGGVAVIADNAHRAMKALDAVKIVWNPGPAASLSSPEVSRRLAQALDASDGHAYYRHGDVEAALKSAAKPVNAEYSAPYLAHGAVEPINCTVQVRDGAARVWVSTQLPGLARRAVSKVLGIDADKVDVQPQLIGGAFGRRLEVDFISQAAAIAREGGGRPVQTIWSRIQDTTHDFYRPACLSRFKAGLDGAGNLVAWHNTSASQAIVPAMLARLLGLPGLGIDKTTTEGAFDRPYEWPNARVGHVIVDLPVPVGFWRSVGHSHQAFFTESFIDELAAAAGKDPVAFRAGLLAKHPRHLAVLHKAADKAGWGKPPGKTADGAALARGLALHEAYGSIVAQVAEVSVAPDKAVRVHRVVCAIDCGMPVNPNLIRQQMESAIIFGLSAALFEEITIVDGQVHQKTFGDFPVIFMNNCPAIETYIMPSQAHPQGVGETGTPPIAPAVANALFALTGQRLRALPLKLA
ncbi:xanthine dehydrogenase family protein molybdopterin-binding subunit [Cupriavidus sp. CV2]|uniref:xanthine dehydrogenase family protein molybdopterin-binding subunit n=1 Tax=Cupriavidus ulmosensis TaxID=3065913 RepID=UPI00296AB6E6|nr:xanthine dehydrogenase family protein molybdopterin-binding subunit [Cupriavidus sp. CV2]MDW3683545.1 xanthine dehydrogenase family protein molybdopterin-binding subunit [Cupriavidus sp. CV2]